MNFLHLILMCVLIAGSFVYFTTCLLAFKGHMRRKPTVEDFTPAVTVVIAARNEEKNIGYILDDLLNQDYPKDNLRIVVVDDCSEDGTVDVVKQFMANDSRVQLRNTRNSRSPYSHKKRAIHEGILTSRGEIIMTTDADCRVSSGWVSSMVKHFTPGVDLVAGTVHIEGGGLFGWLEALEMAGIQSMAAGLMNAGFPITCNGANLAYRRSAFKRVGGYGGIGNMVSGDDDLLMQKIARDGTSKVVFVTGTATAIRTGAADNPGQFFNQRARWASKVSRYPSLPAVALMAVFFAFFAVIPVWLILAFLQMASFPPFFAAYGIKIAGDALLTGYGVIRIGRTELLLMFPLAELVHVPYIIGVTAKGFFGSFEWRGRHTGSVSLECGENAHD